MQGTAALCVEAAKRTDPLPQAEFDFRIPGGSGDASASGINDGSSSGDVADAFRRSIGRGVDFLVDG